MGGCRCSYKNCKNTTKTSDSIHFFHYPVKQKERCKIWIENAEKPHFCNLEEEQLRNKVICEMHFEDKYFPNMQKKRLLHAAIPTLDADAESELQMEEYHDVKILPANDDGTLFVLDTESMFQKNRVTSTQKIESYIYKNGSIVPAAKSASNNTDTSMEYKTFTVKPRTTFTTKIIYPKNYSSEQQQVKEATIAAPPEPNEIDNSNNIEFVEDVEMKSQVEEIQPKLTEPAPKPNTRSTNSPIRKKCEKPVARNYLRKIKQHSREIALIKRLLKKKSTQSVPLDNETILKSLKNQLPPTLFTMLCLTLSPDYELTNSDANFFYDIKNESPIVYQLLYEKYKWNMPSFTDCSDDQNETT